MKEPVGSDLRTRARLLDASTRLFAERGFRKVTVREICRAARANVAAVNYHFGDKLGLYTEVLQRAIEVMRATTDEAREAGRGKPAEERLRAFVSVFLTRIRGTDTWLHRLIEREIADPTAALDAFVEQGLRPRVEYVSSIVAEMLGCAPNDVHVLRCVGSVHSQCLMARPNPIAARLLRDYGSDTPDIEELTNHITEFSLAGIRAVGGRPAKEKREKGKGKTEKGNMGR